MSEEKWSERKEEEMGAAGGEEAQPGEGGDDVPDTGTGDEFGEAPVQAAIPVAEPTFESEAGGVPPPPPPAPAGPRVYPQQYTLLFANTVILVGCLTVWERGLLTGRDMYGFQMIGGSFVLAWAAYSVFAGLVGLVRGGVNLFGSLGTALFALYFAIRSLSRQVGLENFQEYGNFEPLYGMRGAVEAVATQIGPGIYLNLIGGALVFVLFFKALFGGKKKEPVPAARARRGRR